MMGPSESKPSKAAHGDDIKQSLLDSIRNRDIERTSTILKQLKSDSILRITDSDGNPAVHLAVEAGPEMLETLLDYCDAETCLYLLTLKDRKGRSALYMAAKQNDRLLVTKMIAHVQPNEQAALIDNDDYFDDIIAMNVILDTVEVTKRSNLTMEWLNKAMGSQKWEAVQVLLSRIKPDNRMKKLTQHVDKFEHTIIHQFAMMEVAKGCAAIEALTESLDIQERYILLSGRNIYGQTPLDLACCRTRKETALIILSYMENFSCTQNCQIISTDNLSSTPLHYVATRQLAEIIPHMRERLDLDYWESLLILKDKNDLTPLALAVRAGNEKVTEEIRDSIPHSHWLELSEAYPGNGLPEGLFTQAMISENFQETADQGLCLSNKAFILNI